MSEYVENESGSVGDVALFDALLAAPTNDTTRAARIVARRGRAYKGRRGMVTLQVFSTALSDAQELVRVYGGNFYPHSSGYQWACSRHTVLLGVARSVLPVAYDGCYARLSPLFALVAQERINELNAQEQASGTVLSAA